MSKTFIELSRENWVPKDGDFPSFEHLQTGALQRIAAATELMAKNYLEQQAQLNRLKESRDRYIELYDKMVRKNNSLRGVITRMKKEKSKQSH